jgi:hypothetical protein
VIGVVGGVYARFAVFSWRSPIRVLLVASDNKREPIVLKSKYIVQASGFKPNPILNGVASSGNTQV